MRIPAQNPITNRRTREWSGYQNSLEQKRMKDWRVRLANKTLTPDMLSPEEREQLQTWILDHPVKRNL